jgi:hypothetical protein
MDEHQTKNLNQSLTQFNRDLDHIVKSGESLNCWSNALQAHGLAPLVSEIFIDIYASIHFSLCGLYKYADMALRSALENALNVAYFYGHPVEFRWWQNGGEWYLVNKHPHPWGDGYNYFLLLASELPGNKGESTIEKELSTEYRALSKSIHSTSQKLQTKGFKLAPTVDIGRFKQWSVRMNRILSMINSVLVLALRDKFQNMKVQDKTLVDEVILDEHKALLRQAK